MARVKMDIKKVCLNFNNNVLYWVDKFAEDNGLSRTTAMHILLTAQLGSLGYGKEDRGEE